MGFIYTLKDSTGIPLCHEVTCSHSSPLFEFSTTVPLSPLSAKLLGFILYQAVLVMALSSHTEVWYMDLKPLAPRVGREKPGVVSA
jgi:hypothetical protein